MLGVLDAKDIQQNYHEQTLLLSCFFVAFFLAGAFDGAAFSGAAAGAAAGAPAFAGFETLAPGADFTSAFS